MYASNYYHYVYTHERRSGVSNDDVVDIIQGVYRPSRLFLLPGQCLYKEKRLRRTPGCVVQIIRTLVIIML